MRPLLLMTCAALALAACKEDEAAILPDPVELSAEAVGFYCQMELLDHAGPKGQIHLTGMPAPLFFSQVRDAIAYLHMPEQSHAVEATYVQDMAGAATWDRPAGWIGVTEAHYVIGSDRMGGMDAPEYVPFSDVESARAFVARHGGEIRRYDEITTAEVLSTDAPQAGTAGTAGGDMADRLKALSGERGSY
ncbi:MAG: copper resistance protein CopZ [Rhodobacteraceae bacterium]|nr:MAG: copper resistance protein CopZ [Paracoccaceae bacterium]